MGLLAWFKGRSSRGKLLAEAEMLLQKAETICIRCPLGLEDRARIDSAAQRALALLDRVGEGRPQDGDHMALRRAQALFLLGRAGEAREPAYRAAMARPYDVDSRIVHGRIRLALGDLVEAEHEYAAVLEEFSGDPDATVGWRAVALARGALPLEEGLLATDYDAAADLLVAAWDIADVLDDRAAGLRSEQAHTEAAGVIEAAVRRRVG